MKKSDRQVLKEIQRAASLSLDAIKTLSEKVYDDNLALDLNRQAMKYGQIHAKTKARLESEYGKSYKDNPVEKAMVWSGIQANTLLNTSTGHIAEMMILGSSKGILSMYKAMSRHDDASHYAVEMAKELVDFEEKNIERMRNYL